MFGDAFAEFLARDRSLLAKDVNERCLCGRLAIYMQNLAGSEGLEQCYADVDYNRNINDPKRVIGDRPGEGKLIIADLILHSRAELGRQLHRHRDEEVDGESTIEGE